jgi:hypothetical protein
MEISPSQRLLVHDTEISVNLATCYSEKLVSGGHTAKEKVMIMRFDRRRRSFDDIADLGLFVQNIERLREFL